MKKFTLQDLNKAFIAGEQFESDTISVDEGKPELTVPDFDEWVKIKYGIVVVKDED